METRNQEMSPCDSPPRGVVISLNELKNSLCTLGEVQQELLGRLEPLLNTQTPEVPLLDKRSVHPIPLCDEIESINYVVKELIKGMGFTLGRLEI